ncbi:MAG: FecR domain-containing protein, partial [Pirellulaceae bacterium]|nr:FecR domain-containing protein [Pirellulaceae bacterium]
MKERCDRGELLDLLDATANDAIDQTGWARLEEILLADSDARILYRRYVNAHVGLKQCLTSRAEKPAPRPKKSPTLGFLGETAWTMADFFWRPTSFSLLVGVGLPLLCIVLLAVQIRSPRSIEPTPTIAGSVCVARLGRTLDCVWERQSVPPVEGTPLMIDQRLDVTRGLAEIVMANGATVLVEGPVSLLIDSDRLVSLDDGKLTARVPKQARGFTVRAAGVEIVDIGTEFGVIVTDRRNAADVEVFQGEVELAAAGHRDRQTTV